MGYFAVSDILHYLVEVSHNEHFQSVIQTAQLANTALNASLFLLEVGVLTYCRIAAVTETRTGTFAVSSAVPRTPTLVMATMHLANPLSGAQTSGVLQFTLYSILPADGKINLLFSGFDTSLIEFEPVVQGVGGKLSMTRGGLGRILLSRASLESETSTAIPRFSNISLYFKKLVNPHWAGAGATVVIETREKTETYVIDRSEIIHVTGFTAGSLTSLFLWLEYPRAGVGNLTVSARLSDRNPLPVNASITLMCPFGVDFSASVALSSMMVNREEAGSLVIFDAQRMSVHLNRVTGTPIQKGSSFEFRIRNVNITSNGIIDGCNLQTATSSSQPIDMATAAIEILSDFLTDASIQPRNVDSFALTTYYIAFRFGASGLPSNKEALMSFTFPVGINISQAVLLSHTVTGIDFATRDVVSYSWQDVDFEIMGQEIRVKGQLSARPGLRLGLNLGGIRNSYAGRTGTYQIRTFVSNNLLESALHVQASIFEASKLASSIHISAGWSGRATNVTMEFVLTSRAEAGGPNAAVLDIHFPPGYYFVHGPPQIFAQATSLQDEATWLITAYTTSGGCEQTMVSSSCQTNLTLTLTNGHSEIQHVGSVWYWGTAFQFTVGELMTPANKLFSDSITMILSTRSGQVAESSKDQLMKFSSSIVNVSVLPDTLIANTSSTLTVQFESFLEIPSDCVFEITLPDHYTLSSIGIEGPSAMIIQSINIDGTFASALLEREIVVDRSTRNPTSSIEKSGTLVLNRTAGSKLQPYTTVTFIAGPFHRQELSGYTGHFTVSIIKETLVESEIAEGHTLAYGIPTVTALCPTNSHVTGGASITIHGSGFGPMSANKFWPDKSQLRQMSLGERACQLASWVSDSTLVCRSPPGRKALESVVVTIENQIETLFIGFSYDYYLASTYTTNAASNSVASITISGHGFETSQPHKYASRVGGSSCLSSSWVSDSIILCRSSPFVFSSSNMVVTIGSQSKSSYETMSFDLPSTSAVRNSNHAGTGSASVTVHGTGFGRVSFTTLGRGGQTGCEGTEWESETSLRCMASVGMGGSRLAVMTAGGRGGSLSHVMSLDASDLGEMHRANYAGTGSASMTVHGSGLGLVSVTAMGRGGQTGCEGTEWESETSLRCNTARVRVGSQSISVTLGSMGGSMSIAFSSDLVSISSGHRMDTAVNLLPAGSQLVTLTGSMLDDMSTCSGGARLGFTACESSVWVSATSILGKTPLGVSRSFLFVATLGERAGSLTDALSYDRAVLSHVYVSNQPATISTSNTLTMLGAGFLESYLTQRSGLGLTACEASEWTSHTSMACKLTRVITGSTLPASITIGASRNVISQQASYDVSTMSSLVRANGVGTGSPALVTVHGSGLGLAGLTAMGRGGQTGCEKTEWDSETSVRCMTGHGSRGTTAAVVTVGERGGSMTEGYSMDVGSLSLVSKSNGAGTGSTSVTVHGSGLGSLTAIGRGGQTGCEGTEWESETSVRCLVGHGSQETRRLILTSCSLGGSMSEAFSLDTLSLSVMRRTNHGNTGSASVMVHGSSLGSAAFTALGRIGMTGCEGTEWESETSLRCLAGHGARGTRRLMMTAGDRSGSMSEAYSFDLTGTSLINRGNRAGMGSSSVTVHGSGLGLVLMTVLGRVGQTGCEGTEWGSETSVRCLLGRGIQGTRRMEVTAGEREGTGSAMYSMDVGSLSAVWRSNRAGTGSASVTVHGSGLGLVSFTEMGRIGQTGCEGTEWGSETSVRCLVGSSAPGTRRVALTAGAFFGSLSHMISFDMGSVSVSHGVNRAGTGSVSVTVHGAGLGVVGFTGMVRLGKTGCEGTEWASVTALQCLVGHATQGTRRLVMTSGGRGGSMSQGHSVDTGSMSAAHNINHAGTGAASVTVLGSSMGLVAVSANGRIGQTGCEGSMWESETSVQCRVGHGARGTRLLAMSATFSERVGSMSGVYSVDAGSVSAARSGNHAGTVSASVTVHGSSLGLVGFTAMGRVGETGCEGTEWESETTVRCLVGHGARGTRRVVMTAGERGGSMSEGYSVEAASMSVMRRGNHGGTGSASMTVHGSSLGLVALTALGRMGQTGCEGTGWESETSVRCLVGQGIRGTLRVVMTAGERTGSGSAMYSVDVGSMSVTRGSNLAGLGSASVTVLGAGLGLGALTALGRMGQTGWEGTEWESETSVQCRMAQGARGTRRVAVTAGERVGSLSQVTSFDAGSVCISRRINRAGTGSASVTVLGAGLGLVGFTGMVRSGQTGCEGTEWESETTVQCRVGHGAGGTRRMTITASERVGSMSEVYSVDAGSVSAARSGNHAGTVSASVTVHGSSLGLVGFTAMGRVGETGCEGTEWESETTVRCLVGHGARGTRRVVMTAGERGGSMSEGYSVEAASMSVMRRGNHGGTGSASMTVHGSSLGLVALTALGRMGQTGCEGTGWESETSVRCLVGQGIRGTRRVVMTAGERTGSGSAMYSVDVGSMSVTRGSNLAGLGSASVTVHGAGLGLGALTALGRMGQTGCEGTEWESETSVQCRMAQGARGTRRVVMTAGERTGSGSAMYCVDVGSMSVTRGSNLAGTGSASVTVLGAGLGLVALTALGRMGQTGCEGTGWESETSVQCRVGHGARGTRRVAVTAGERVGSLSQVTSFDAGSVCISRRINRAGTGSASVTVLGAGLGLVGFTGMVRSGQTGCEGTEWESETSVQCRVGHGAGGTRRMTITASERVGSMSEVYSVDAGSVSAARSGNHAGTVSASVTVHGSSLGLVGFTAMGRVGETGCEGTEWESETTVRCLVGHGARGTRRVVMTAGERGGSMSEGYSVEAASMSVMRRGNHGGTGSASMTVHGSSLGLVALTALGRMGQTGCEGTGWESETSVRCLVGQGIRGTRRVVMTAGERTGSGSAMYSVDVGSMSVTRGSNLAGTWVGFGDGARGGSGAGCVDGAGTDGADGMRGDGVGVGDVSAVPDGAMCTGHKAGGGDCW
jgi:hypothetical protein